ncbi:MAG: hypothetical protein ACXWUB_08330, partial [Burkholderiales bacterium]
MLRTFVLAILCCLVSAAHARTEIAQGTDADFVPRLIVKFRTSGESAEARIARLAAHTGVPLAHVRTLATSAEVLASPA